MVNTFVFMSRTGGGKGTQARLLSQRTGFTIFSTGDRFRELRAREGSLGKRIRSDLDAGLLMPSWFSTFLFEEAILYLPLTTGVICEGVGRKEPEARAFHEVMSWLGREYIVIYLEVSEETTFKRQLERAARDPSRVDSNTEEKIRLRMREFDTHTVPALEYFRSLGKVIDVDGEQSIEEVEKEIMSKITLQ